VANHMQRHRAGQLGVSEGREHGADRKAWVARLATPVNGVAADAPMDQPREAHHSARPLHSPEGGQVEGAPESTQVLRLPHRIHPIYSSCLMALELGK
jgi:hypothetical protein